MEFDAINYYQQNAQKLKVRESTSYGVHIDEGGDVIVSCTDFGHIHMYHREKCGDVECDEYKRENTFQKKTLCTENPPIYSSHLANYNSGSLLSKILFCGGRNNNLRGYSWDNLLSAVHSTTMPAVFDVSLGNREGNIVAIASSPQKCLVFAATDHGRIFCSDVMSGECVMDSATSGDVHSTSVHSLHLISGESLLLSCDSRGLLGVWDVKTGGNLLKTVDIGKIVANYLGVSSTKLWLTTMDVDMDGNFIYVGGGVETSKVSGSKAHNTFHRTCTGFLASFFLSDDNANIEEDLATLVLCRATPVPVQVLHLSGSELVTGGSQPLLTFWTSHNLDPISSMMTSSQSLFSITSFHENSESSLEKRTLAVAGTLPVVDLISVVGHKEAVLWPPQK